MKLNDVLKNTNYDYTLFTDDEIIQVESLISVKSSSKGDIPYVKCQVRDKDIKLTPEEAVRQLYYPECSWKVLFILVAK